MTSFHSLRRAAAILAVGVVAAAGAPVAAGGNAQQRGDAARAQALDKRYGNAWTRISPAEFRRLVSSFGPDVMTQMTPQEARAELARGEALNRLYGIAWTRVSPAEFRRLVGLFGEDVTKMTPQQARALLARGIGLNQLAERYTVVKPASGGGDGFDWGDAGIGVAAAFGVMLLAAAGALALRVRRRVVLHS